jgi:preprotein translocase subunit SecG
MNVLFIFQIIISIILVALVMLQSKDSGLSNPFGATQTGYQTKTGPEKAIYVLTIFVVIIFIVVSILNIRS